MFIFAKYKLKRVVSSNPPIFPPFPIYLLGAVSLFHLQMGTRPYIELFSDGM